MITVIAVSQNANLRLAIKIVDEIKAQGVDVECIDLSKIILPLYGLELKIKDHQKDLDILITSLKNSKGLFVVAPEYNGGVPPLFSNALCWLSLSGDHWRELFQGKVAALATHSGSGDATKLFSALSGQLETLGMTVVGRKIITHYKRSLQQETLSAITKEFIRFL